MFLASSYASGLQRQNRLCTSVKKRPYYYVSQYLYQAGAFIEQIEKISRPAQHRIILCSPTMHGVYRIVSAALNDINHRKSSGRLHRVDPEYGLYHISHVVADAIWSSSQMERVAREAVEQVRQNHGAEFVVTLGAEMTRAIAHAFIREKIFDTPICALGIGDDAVSDIVDEGARNGLAITGVAVSAPRPEHIVNIARSLCHSYRRVVIPVCIDGNRPEINAYVKSSVYLLRAAFPEVKVFTYHSVEYGVGQLSNRVQPGDLLYLIEGDPFSLFGRYFANAFRENKIGIFGVDHTMVTHGIPYGYGLNLDLVAEKLFSYIEQILCEKTPADQMPFFQMGDRRVPAINSDEVSRIGILSDDLLASLKLMGGAILTDADGRSDV